MRLGTFWGLTAPMLLLAYDDFSEIEQATVFTRESTNSEMLQNLHKELHYLIQSSNFASPRLLDQEGGWFSEREPRAYISKGSFSAVSCQPDVAFIDLRNEMVTKLAQKIISGESRGRYVFSELGTRKALEDKVDDYIRSSTFYSADVPRIVNSMYRESKDPNGSSVASTLLMDFPYEMEMSEQLLSKFTDPADRDCAMKVFKYYQGFLPQERKLFELTRTAKSEDLKVFNIELSNFLRRKPNFLEYVSVHWFKYLQGNKSAANLNSVVEEYSANLATLEDAVKHSVKIADDTEFEQTTDFSMYEVSVFLPIDTDYSEDEVLAINNIYQHVKDLSVNVIAEKIGVEPQILERNFQHLCDIGICGMNKFSLELFKEAVKNVVLTDSFSCRKTEAYIEELQKSIQNAKDLLRNIKPIGAEI